jgi:hypothetical protein
MRLLRVLVLLVLSLLVTWSCLWRPPPIPPVRDAPDAGFAAHSDSGAEQASDGGAPAPDSATQPDASAESDAGAESDAADGE